MTLLSHAVMEDGGRTATPGRGAKAPASRTHSKRFATKHARQTNSRSVWSASGLPALSHTTLPDETFMRSKREAIRGILSRTRWLAGVVLALFVAVLAGCGQSKDAAPVPAERSRKQLQLTDGTSPQPLLIANVATASPLPSYELKMAPRELTQLEHGFFENVTHPATFIANGVTYTNVRVRFRGQWARTWPKKPLKIFFDHEQLFEGRRCLNLNSGWRDPAFVREPLAYQVYAACGVPAPRARMVRLQMNGSFRGLYVEVEQPDKVFANRINRKGASVFKAASGSNQSDERDLGSEANYGNHYHLETQKSHGLGPLQSFCHDLAGASNNAAAFFNQRVDLDEYVNYLAATTLIQNWDCFSKNHFLLFDGRESRKWLVIPWDLDRTFGDHWQGGFDDARIPILLGTRPLPGPTGWNRMEARFFSDTTLRMRFLNRLEELLEKEFTAEKLFPILDRLESDISADAAQDRARWPGTTSDLHGGIAQLKSYIKRRRAFLQGEVARMRQSKATL